MAKPTTGEVAGAAGGPAGRPPRGPFKPRKQHCIALGALIGLIFAGAIGLYVWQSGEMARTREVLAAREEEVRISEKAAGRLAGLEEGHGAMQNELRYLETSVTAGEYVPTLLKQTENLAKSVHLQVGGVRPTLEPAPKPPDDKEARKKWRPWPYDKIHVDMELRGGYWNVAKLLYRLTEFPKILAVESVQVQPTPNPKPGVSPELTVNLKLTGFIFKDEPAAARPAAVAGDTAAPASRSAAGAAAQQ